MLTTRQIYRDKLQVGLWYSFSFEGNEYAFQCGPKYTWRGGESFNLMELIKNGNKVYNREACYYDDIVNFNESIVFTEIKEPLK